MHFYIQTLITPGSFILITTFLEGFLIGFINGGDTLELMKKLIPQQFVKDLKLSKKNTYPKPSKK